MANKNVYIRRLVAETGAKACWICYKPSSTVLINEDSTDHFYLCPGHLSDPKFATAKDAEDMAKKKRDEEIEREIEAVKKEYEEKTRKKTDRKSQKEHEKNGEESKEEKKRKEDEDDEKEKEEKLKELEKKKEPEKAKVEGPRIFELQKSFYQMRLQKKRDAEAAKRNRERMRNPQTFPSVPSGDP